MILRFLQRTCRPCLSVFCSWKARASLIAAAALVPFAAGVSGQELKTPQVEGSYLGVTQLGVVEPVPTEIGLAIEIQDSRRFRGTLSYVEQDNLIVSGSIASSGKCQITAESDEARATIQLDWQNFGGGAAILIGELALTTVRESQTGPVAFLRPFDNPAVDWSRQTGRYSSSFTSASNREPIHALLDITAGARGILRATIAGWTDPDSQPILPDPPGWTDPDTQPVVIGTTSAAGGLIAVGVGSGPNQIVTLTGNVATDEEGLAVAIDGTYRIDHTTGKRLDQGTFRVHLAP